MESARDVTSDPEAVAGAKRIARKYALGRVGCEYDDLFQVALLALHEAGGSYDGATGTFASYAGWRMRNAVVNEVRRTSPKTRGGNDRLRMADVEDMDAFLERRPGGPDGEDPEVDGIDALTPRERRMMSARADGFTLKEIGRREGVSESRVSQIATRARSRIEEARSGIVSTQNHPPPCSCMSRDGWPRPKAPYDPHYLSSRELAVLEAAAEGLTSGETGERFHIGKATVMTYRKKIIRKLEARSMIHAVAIGFRSGLLP